MPGAERPSAAATAALLAGRVAALEALFRDVASTRMAGVPMLHPALAVQAVGFEADAEGSGAVGVLITPWFMNLVWLPLAAAETALAIGDERVRPVGNQRFGFLGGHEPAFGAYESCSLFSPMFEFVDQAAAVATAQAVLAELRRPPEPPPAPVQASRRAMLFGRGAGDAR